jgi:thiosulfate dehydrogenase
VRHTHFTTLCAVLPLALAACRSRDGTGAGSTAAGGAAAAAAAPAPRVPSDDDIPRGPVGDAIRRGRAIALATRESLPDHVGNALRCASCHPDAGTRAYASPWLGVYARFPQYRARSGRVDLLEDRINDCFARSMNGTPLPAAGRDMHDLVAYMAFLSRGVPVGGDVAGQGLRPLDPLPGDTARGRAVFASACAHCHGADGQGAPAAPPVWGPQSYNVGAGMARVRTLAAFVRVAMPYDRPGTLTDQQAVDVAAFVDSRPRPDFAGKERDWPNGDPPPDVAYRTLAAERRAERPRAPPRP